MAITWKKIAYADDVIANTLLTERGSVIYRNATIPAELLHGSSGQMLTSGGHGADPSWTSPVSAADYIAKAFMAAKGDLIGASANDAPAILSVGTDGYVLTAQAAAANGLGIDWLTPAAPAAHTLNSHSVPNGAVDFDLQQATDLVVMTVVAEANLPAATVAKGQLCWATTEATLHVCTIAA